MVEYLIDENDRVVATMFGEGLMPIPLMTVSEWSDTYRMLTSTSSAEPGKFRTVRVPYIEEIADHLGKTSDVWKIAVIKGAQLGFTELGNNFVGYVMHLNPGPIIMVMPTDAAVKKNSRTRIKPMIESTPELRDKIKPAGSKEAGNTVDSKEFPGGVLIMIGANSPVGLSSTPAGNIFLDEVDRYPLSAGDEGSPVDLAEARASTFSNKKIFIISTPTTEGESVIDAEFKEGDQRYYNVPCRACKSLFVIRFELIVWEEGKPETAGCACPECGNMHYERDKTWMLAKENGAKWIPTATPSDPLIRSYHLSGLYSPAGWLSWVQVARKFLKIKGDANKEKTFINTILGETYKIKGESPEYENLYNRRELYPVGIVPPGVYFLTMGVDVQRDRLECEVVGWGVGRESWSVDYIVLDGDTTKDEVWAELTEVINKHFEVYDGSLMQIARTAIDSGDNTKKVYDYCAKFSQSKVIPIKGSAATMDVMVRPPKTINVNRAGKPIKANKVWYLGTGLLKTELYGFLGLKAKGEDDAREYPPGYCHFPQYGENYFMMLTAEEQVLKKDKKGYTKYEWIKKRQRNEALDVRCYARAAAYIVGIDRFKDSDWDKIKDRYKGAAVQKEAIIKKKATQKPKSDYWKKNR